MTRREKTHVLAWLDAVRDAGLSTNAVAVALVCATFADYGSGEGMRASHALLAECAGLRQRATRYAVAELRAAGLLAWDGRRTAPGITRTYALSLPEHRHRGAPVRREHRHRGAAEHRHETARTAARNGQNGGTTVPPTKAYQGRPGANGAQPVGSAARTGSQEQSRARLAVVPGDTQQCPHGNVRTIARCPVCDRQEASAGGPR